MDTRNIDACIKILEDKNYIWCKVYVNEIKEAFMYATNRCNNRITFIFMIIVET